MECPYCHTNMEFGYMQSRDGFSWSKYWMPMASIAKFNSDAIPLRNSTSRKSVYACICQSCKIVLIEYDKNLNEPLGV